MGETLTQSELILRRADWKRNGRRVVFAAGAFDLLHPGHIRLLEQARSYGDVLVVTIQDDAAVKAAHAAATSASVTQHARPINPACERAEILAALAAVDFVTVFDSESPTALIAQLQPEMIVEGQARPLASSGSEFPATQPTNQALPKIIHIPLEPGYSTTSLLDRIQQLRRQNPPPQPNA